MKTVHLQRDGAWTCFVGTNAEVRTIAWILERSWIKENETARACVSLGCDPGEVEAHVAKLTRAGYEIVRHQGG